MIRRRSRDAGVPDAAIAPVAGWPFVLACAGVIAAFVVTRSIAFQQMGASVYGRQLFLDTLSYHELAVRISSGRWQQETAHFLGPGWPILLGVWYDIAGSTIAAGRLLNTLLSFGTLLAIMALSWRVGGRAATVAAGALWALYGPTLFHEQTLLMETAAGFLTLLAVAAAAFLLLWPGGGDAAPTPPPIGRAALVGAVLGIGVLFRANSALALPVLLAVLLLRARAAGAPRTALPAAAAMVAAMLATFVPTAIHNHRAEGILAPISTNLGINLFIGFNERADGTYVVPPSAEGEMRGLPYAQMKTGRARLDSAELSVFWSAEARAWIAANPGRAVALVARKALLLLDAREVPQLYDPAAMAAEVPYLAVPWIGYAVVLPLAAAGLVLLWRRDRPAAILLGGTVAALMASLLPFFVTGRYRLPMAPLLCCLAGAALPLARDAMRAAGPRALAVPGAWLAVMAIASWPPWLGASPDLTARFDEIRSGLWLRDGDAARSESILAAIPEDRLTPSGMNRLGKITEERRGDFCLAASQYQRAAEAAPFVAQFWLNAAQAALRCSQQTATAPDDRTRLLEAAATAYERGLQLDPALSDGAWLNLAEIRRQQGRRDDAIRVLRAFLERRPAHPAAMQRLAQLGG